MGILFDITHTTTYRYTKPVAFGEHRVMFRPRDSHDMRVLATNLEVDPPARHVRLIQDVYSNSVAIVQPVEQASSLSFVCTFTVEHMGSRALDLPIEEHARTHPFVYDDEERIALQHYLQPFYPEEDEVVRQWATRFTSGSEHPDTRMILLQMNQAIREEMHYEPRDAEGVQSPAETLRLGKGTCRDFATLMIEAVRQLGYAARFVSGYIYSPHLQSSSGATHAWLQVYLPGSGWIPFDPTNNLAGGTSLIRVGVARHASLAVPLQGIWTGAPADFIGMTVDVQVHKRDTAAST
jgi:transglutaminase-like putative cysteine protease